MTTLSKSIFQLRRKALATNKRMLFNEMRKLGIHSVSVAYEGNEGDFTTTVGYRSLKNNKECLKTEVSYTRAVCLTKKYKMRGEITAIKVSLNEAFNYFVYDLLNVEQPSWLYGRGSEGSLTINATEQRCLLQHTSFFTESITSRAAY